MKPILGFLLIICLVGCGKDTPTGPQGQTLEVYEGEDRFGNKIEYQFYRNGNEEVKHGYYKRFDEDGQINIEGSYKDGYRDGKWVWYDENGKIEIESTFKGDKFEINGHISYLCFISIISKC